MRWRQRRFSRARRLRPGQFAEHEDAWDAALNVTDAASDDELYGVGTPLEGKVKPTIDDLARQRAAQALIDVKKKPKTKLLSALFDDYQRFNPESGKALQDRTRYWNTAISYIGETYASSDSADRIREGLNTWVSDRLDNITAASAQRELGSVMVILNWADEALGLGWVIRPIPPAKLKPHKARTKTPLNKEQQVEFLRWLHEKNDGKSAVLAIMLNGGVSATEIAGLDVEDTRLGLAAEHPHVVVTKGKTKNRVRIVPITVAVELIQAQGIDGIEWAKSIHPSSVSATLNKRLHKAGFEETTTHALRHTLAGNAKINRVSNVELELIAGWRNQSDVSDFVMHYGAEERSEYITPLTAASRDIHQHLLTAHGNVVPMKRKAVSP